MSVKIGVMALCTAAPASVSSGCGGPRVDGQGPDGEPPRVPRIQTTGAASFHDAVEFLFWVGSFLRIEFLRRQGDMTMS
jgi:hypothetical protein